MYDKTYKRQGGVLGFLKTVVFMIVLAVMVFALMFTVYGDPETLDTIANRPVIAANTSAPTRQVASPSPRPTNLFIDTADFVRSQHLLVLRPTDLASRYRVILDFQYSNVDLPFKNAPERARYVNLTGRVDGWEITLERIDPDTPGPFEYTSRVEVFETVEGAKDAIGPGNFWVYTNDKRAPDELINKKCRIGSDCALFQTIPPSPKSGQANLRYDIAYRYKNVIVWVTINGLEEELDLTQLLDAAEIIYQKLQSIE